MQGVWLIFVEVFTDYAKRALYIVIKRNFIWCLADSTGLRTENQKVDIFAVISLQLLLLSPVCSCVFFVSFFFFLILPLFVVFWYFFLFDLWLVLVTSSLYFGQPSLDVNCTAWKMQIIDLKQPFPLEFEERAEISALGFS